MPPSVGTFYDSLLQSALRQFFERATVEVQPVGGGGAGESGLAIEPSANPGAIIIRWFGMRYTLRVPGRWVFTAHEVRLAQAIGSVLAARYQAIVTPRIIAERGELFRGAIEDRYVGAFLDPRVYAIDDREARADRIAAIIELLRVAALSSYENRPISTGVLLLGTTQDPLRHHAASRTFGNWTTEALTSIKSFFRLADGMRTVFLANAEGRLLDIIDIERWGRQAGTPRTVDVPGAKTYEAHARATMTHGHVCAVLSPSREIKVFAEGAQVFAFRAAGWHLLDVQAKFRVWAAAVGNDALATRLFQTALDLADERQGALFAVVRDPGVAVARLVAAADRLGAMPDEMICADVPSRRDLLRLLEGRSATELDPSVLAALASLDGATVVDRSGALLAAGAILRHVDLDLSEQGVVEGARTTAAMAASRFGPVLKVSEDGMISFYDNERVWDI
jgi:hypothetical protein